jgi:hypothetical protein
MYYIGDNEKVFCMEERFYYHIQRERNTLYNKTKELVMDYNTLNNKIVELIKEKYLKSFCKEVKKFQIIMAGYNASKYKSLQVFKKYGWNVHFIPIREKEGIGRIMFVYDDTALKASFLFYMKKDLKTGILSEISSNPKGYVEVCTDEMEIVKLIKRLEKSIPDNQYLTMMQFGNDKLKYTVCHQTFTNMYILRFSYPKN